MKRKMKSFIDVKSYADVYDQDFSAKREILDKDTQKPIPFASTPKDQKTKREISYNLALYRICHGLKIYSDDAKQFSCDETTFNYAVPVIEDIQKTIVNQAKNGRVAITEQQIDEISEKNSVFKDTDAIIVRALAPQNLHAVCEYVLDQNIDTNQNAFNTNRSASFEGPEFYSYLTIKKPRTGRPNMMDVPKVSKPYSGVSEGIKFNLNNTTISR